MQWQPRRHSGTVYVNADSGSTACKSGYKGNGLETQIWSELEIYSYRVFCPPTVFQFIGAVFYYLVFRDDFAPSEAFRRFMSSAEYEEFVKDGSPYISVIATDIIEDLNPFFTITTVFLHLARR